MGPPTGRGSSQSIQDGQPGAPMQPRRTTPQSYSANPYQTDPSTMSHPQHQYPAPVAPALPRAPTSPAQPRRSQSPQPSEYASYSADPYQGDRSSTSQPRYQYPVEANQDPSHVRYALPRSQLDGRLHHPQSTEADSQYQGPSMPRPHSSMGASSAISVDTTSYEEQRQPLDSPDGHRVNVNVNVSTEKDVCESTPGLVASFLVDRMDYDGYEVPQGLASRRRKNESEIAFVLRRMGDDISRNTELNHLISGVQVTTTTAYATFAKVAWQIFQDGNINWGRVAMLFYFAYKLALQVLKDLPLIDLIIGWVTRFIKDKLAQWISSRGGWNAIREYYGSTTGQMLGVFLAGVLLSSLFWYWKK